MTEIVVISDTHNFHNEINMPPGDILIHCGDFSGTGSNTEFIHFISWFEVQNYQHKILVAGNHDFTMEDSPVYVKAELKNRDFIYLQDSSVTLEGIKFYGSPWQPWFYDWAFNLERGKELADKWTMIPDDTDFLITHGPPQGILDKTIEGELAGCEDLLKRVKEVKPRYHTFGHIHEGYGAVKIDETVFINASICTRSYNPINKPVIVSI